MKKTYVNKKAFTMIEITLALVLVSMITYYIVKQMIYSEYILEVTNTQNLITQIVHEGILGEDSYATREGGGYFDNLNAHNLVDAMQWSDRFDVEGSLTPPVYPTWGRMLPLTNELMRDYGGCSIEIKGIDSRTFDIFVDCSEVNFNERSPEFLEDAIEFVFTDSFADIKVGIYTNAESMEDTALQGSTEDGKIRGRLSL